MRGATVESPPAPASVRRGELPRLLELHVLVVALSRALAGLRAKDDRAALVAPVSPAKLVRHDCAPTAYVRFSAGFPQHLSVPSPPLVTTNCAPHTEHE